ncbi:unnamed protein product [Menidia menidia]|uniref:(Atlantic silverside) hypothetical protein n=1 Tax=Menidia menidia TaxID=238744 RepID=A0A8S4AR09_9TELE|nr:unnamed protein product [Menidia menidia]
MARSGVCCGGLQEPPALMKMGLGLIVLGHLNFLLGALVHGVVLRRGGPPPQARAPDYAVANVVALASGMVGAVVGILAIILSKNKKSRGLTWSLLAVSLLSALMAAASALGLLVSVVMAVVQGGRSLLSHCRFPDAIGYSSVTTECPFDPTRIYSTTLILWVPLIVTCVVQLVFSARCLAACVSFLGLPCCPMKKRLGHYAKAITVVRPAIEAPRARYTEPPRSHKKPDRRDTEPLRIYNENARLETEPPRRTSKAPRRASAPPRHQHRPPSPPQHLSRQHQSLPPSDRQPLRQPHREHPDRERLDRRTGGQHRAPEQHQLLQRGALERSSFWI